MRRCWRNAGYGKNRVENQRVSRLGNWAKKFRPTFLLLHMFADGLGIAATGNVHLGNLSRVPNIGHIFAFFSKVAVRHFPTFVHSLCLQLARFAHNVAWRVTVVCRSRGIHQLADNGTIKRICAVVIFNLIDQRHHVASGYQGQLVIGLQT